jgi:hypothetical protein
MDAAETLIPELRCPYGAIRTSRVANIDHPLNTLKRVSVRTEQILEESYPVAAHRTLSHRSVAKLEAVPEHGFDLAQKAIFDGAARPRDPQIPRHRDGNLT